MIGTLIKSRGALFYLLVVALLSSGRIGQAQTIPAWSKGQIIDHVPVDPSNKVIAFGFDDGPSPTYSPQILNVLKQYNAKATFFEIGQNLVANPSTAQALQAAGMVIGNHTWSHQESPADPVGEVTKTDDAIKQYLGYTPTLFRPPFGNMTNGVVDQAISENDAIIIWNIDPLDWSMPGANSITSTVLQQAKPGRIVLMHDGGGDRSQSVAALSSILASLSADGYRFVTIPELLSMYNPVAEQGLTATYYNNADLTGTSVRRLDPTVNFNWGSGSPDAAIAADTFSARWEGQVQPQFSEKYTFYTKVDDGVRLWVNGTQIINHWNNVTSATEYSGSITLTAGTKYDIRLEYYENTGNASAILSWSSAHTAKAVIPQSRLWPVADTTAPSIVVSTPRVNGSYRSLAEAVGSTSDSGGNAITSGVEQIRCILNRVSDNTFWDGGGWQSWSSEVPAPGVATWFYQLPQFDDGQYRFQAVVQDYAGNLTYTSWIPFTIDNTAPAVRITAPTSNGSYASLTKATGTASDNGGGVASVKTRLYRYSDGTFWNGSAWTKSVVELAATGTTSWTFTLPALASGKYYVQAVARDVAGNTTYTPTSVFTLGSSTDSTPPTISLNSPVTNGNYRVCSQASGVASDSGGSGLQQVRGLLFRKSDSTYWNGSAWTTTLTDNPVTGTTSWVFRLPSLADGHYEVEAKAVDGAGNVTYTPWIPFTVDLTQPVVRVTTPTSNAIYVSLPQASGTATDANGIVSVKARLYRFSDATFWNGSAWTKTVVDLPATGTGNWSFSLPPLAQGKYYVQGIARDPAGNAGYSPSTVFNKTGAGTSVATPMTIQLLPGSPITLSDGDVDATNGTITLRFTGALDAANASDAGHYTIEIDGAPTQMDSCSYNPLANTVILHSLAQSLQSSGRIVVTWTHLRDAAGLNLTAGEWKSMNVR
jgi:peptidoglycan/xylan/chitin deacetylase (PgdA/CDA1 family)